MRQIISELRAERRAGGSGGGGQAQRDCAGRVPAQLNPRARGCVVRRRWLPEGRTSPEEDVDAIRKVTLVDVNRVAKAISAQRQHHYRHAQAGGQRRAGAQKGFGGGEKVTAAPTKPVKLPEWAAGPLDKLQAPSNYIAGLRHQRFPTASA